MHFHRGAALLIGLLFPVSVLAAADTPITRRDGFLLLWQTIARPAEDTREMPFSDVQEGSTGFKEITYAKYRGILDDGTAFHPDAALTLNDAFLWLLRTRSVADIKELTPENVPTLLEKNEIIVPAAARKRATVTQPELQVMLASLDEVLRTQVHQLSLYGEEFHGQGTAFGETFDMHALTAAHRTFPYNTLVKVTNTRNGKSVTVRINDRGPYVKGRDMDLSVAAFEAIEDRSKGVANARFERLGDASLVGACRENIPRQIRITKAVRLLPGIPWMMKLGDTLTEKSTQWFVIRGITYPDGTFTRVQDFIAPGDPFTFSPSVEGDYIFLIGSKEGRRREFRMRVEGCN